MTGLESTLLIACGFLIACNLISLVIARVQNKSCSDLCDAVERLTKMGK